MTNTSSPTPSLLLFSQDRRLAQTRQWVLEQARYEIVTVYSLADLDAAGSVFPVKLFLLCNSLSADIRAEAVARIRSQWPGAKILIFVPSYPLPELPADEFFYAMEGPGKLIQTIRSLVPNDQPSVNELTASLEEPPCFVPQVSIFMSSTRPPKKIGTPSTRARL